jgi:serine/threonine-protein kinase SRK2
MGNCLGGPSTKDEVKSKQHSSRAKRIPDFALTEQFEVIKLLGSGGEGETWLCKEIAINENVAIKFVRRPIPKAVVNLITREIKIQADLGQGHLNIVYAREVVLSKTHLGLAMEFVAGGNMVNYVSLKRETRHLRAGLALDEDEARYFFKQLICEQTPANRLPVPCPPSIAH